MKDLVLWGSYLYFPFLLACAYAVYRGRMWVRAAMLLALIPASILAYARFVEPARLMVVETDIDLAAGRAGAPLRIAVFADTHFGRFHNAVSLVRIVSKVNAQNVDAVFIPGDFVYHLPEERFEHTFAPLAELNAPVFAVLGNHDVGFPGPDIGEKLIPVLEAYGVKIVENRAISAEIGGQKVTIAGTSDLWKRDMSFDFQEDLTGGPLIFIAHNPDTAYSIPPDIDYDILLAGHTHGAQIRLPGMVRRVIPTDHPFDHGLHQINLDGKQRRVFVTSGTGMVGLPMRFRMPPRIDILNLQMPED